MAAARGECTALAHILFVRGFQDDLHARLPCHKVYRDKLDRLLIKVKVDQGKNMLV